jgi:hypothetical protein
MKCELQISYTNIISQDSFSLPNLINATNVPDYGMLIIHEPNASFPITRLYFIMLCNKDILQLFFEDQNQSMSPLKISYHYISSVTVSSSNRHPVCAGCLLSRHVLLGHLYP